MKTFRTSFVLSKVQIIRTSSRNRSSSSEYVLTMLNKMRKERGSQTLASVNQHPGWVLDDRMAVVLFHRYYYDQGLQKVSPADKPRIQLQVVLNDDNSTTFLFSNPEGKESQMKDREKVKDWLIQLLPKFKIKISKELEEKNRILKENPLVLQLYKELVIPEVVSSEVFWTEFAPPLIKVSEPEEKQVVGVSSGFLAEIKPQADGVNDLRVNLTKNMIDSIFRTYPAVQKKKLNNVLRFSYTKLMFATKLFWSHLPFRTRSFTFPTFTQKKCLFDPQRKLDPLLLTTIIKGPLGWVAQGKISWLENASSKDYYWIVNKKKLHALSLRELMVKTEQQVPFTQHSVNVLKTTSHAKEGTNGENGAASTVNGQSGLETDVVPSKKARLQEATEIDDLEGGPLPDEALIAKSKLKINRVDRYLNGPTVSTETNREIEVETELNLPLSRAVSLWCMENAWAHLITSTASTMALRELSIGGKLMSCSALDSIAANISEEIQNELRELYRAVCELLRHFWSTLTTQQPGGDEKILIVFESLINFQKKKLKPFEDKEVINTNITRHLQCLLQIADKKFKRWDEMRQK
nr:EOG090X04EN [Artemia franciscana]